MDDSNSAMSSLESDLVSALNSIDSGFGVIMKNIKDEMNDIEARLTKLEIDEMSILNDFTITKLKPLFDKNKIDINYRFYNNTKLLHVACARNNYHVIKFLILKGADVNEKDKDGRSCLYYMYEQDKFDPKCIELLIENGLDTKDQSTGPYMNIGEIMKYSLSISIDTLLLLMKHGSVIPESKRPIFNYVRICIMLLSKLSPELVRMISGDIKQDFITEDRVWLREHRRNGYYSSSDDGW